MEGEHLYNYEIGDFDNFEAEAIQSGTPEDSPQQDVDEDIDTLRVKEYEQIEACSSRTSGSPPRSRHRSQTSSFV